MRSLPRERKVLAELALHHHDEICAPLDLHLVAALRRIMREGTDAASLLHSQPLPTKKEKT